MEVCGEVGRVQIEHIALDEYVRRRGCSTCGCGVVPVKVPAVDSAGVGVAFGGECTGTPYGFESESEPSNSGKEFYESEIGW